MQESRTRRSSFPLAGCIWRPGVPDDSLALMQLRRVLRAIGRDREVDTCLDPLCNSGNGSPASTLCAVEGARILAFASATVYSTDEEHRGDIETLVHPDADEYSTGSFLLSWAEMEARQHLGRLPHDRPQVLRIAFTDRRDIAVALSMHRGFHLQLVSNTMRRDLDQPLPTYLLPADIKVHPWNEERSPLFHEVYLATFGTRPGFQSWPRSIWERKLIEASGLRPDLSLLLAEGSTPVGYIICWINQEENHGLKRNEGWIAQLGVIPEWQRRGMASWMMGQAMRAFKMDNIHDAMLEVNEDNTAARRLYESLGFKHDSRLTVYVKPI